MNGSQALTVNADGSVAVSREIFPSGDLIDPQLTGGAFIWVQANGVQNLKLFLENDYGLDLSGWIHDAATGISADGMTIVGNGSFNIVDQAWIATISNVSVTELSSFPASRPAFFFLAAFRRR